MIEADIKGFLNDRTPVDPAFKPLNRQLEAVLSAIEREKQYEKRRRLFDAANEHYKTVTPSTTSTAFWTCIRSSIIPSNLFPTGHYANDTSWTPVNSFNFKLSDDLLTSAYLYTDGGNTTYSSWKLAGGYNPVFLTTGTRTAMTFSGITNDGWAVMDMSADGGIIVLSKNVDKERLVVLRRTSGSNYAYTAVSVSAQPTVNVTSLRVSGDGSKIFLTMANSPYLLIYEANANKTAYIQTALSNIGVSVSRAVNLVVPSFDGATFALGYTSGTAVEVYRMLSGTTYSKVGVDFAALNNLTTLHCNHREGLQLSRDGKTLLMYLLYANNVYEPMVLKFNENSKRFSMSITEHNNQLWRASYPSLVYGAWHISSHESRWELSADGDWLFCSLLVRSTSTTPFAYTQLYVMDISGGTVRRNVPIHSALLTTANPGTGAGSQFVSQHIFWIDPKMRYVLKGIIPYSNYQNTSPYYAYHLYHASYTSYEIVLLDDCWQK